MRPTTRALALARPIAEMLGQVRRLLDAGAAFDPLTSERRFVLGIAPFATYTMLPSFVRMFRAEAPHAQVHYLSLEMQDEASLLDESRIDLAVGIVVDLPKRFGTCVLFRDRPVCITRKDYPALRGGMTLERFIALPHAHATHYMEAVVDSALAQHLLARRVVMVGHNYLAMGVLVAHSDVLAIVPARLARDLARRGEVDVHEVPLPLEEQPIGLAWSKHGQSDPAVMWLRDRIYDVMAERPGATAAAHQSSSRARRSASRR
jgi:DNA-binding transcriptional LysR family regulator